MIFTDTRFWWFFALVIILVVANGRYWKSVRMQNVILLVASYYFYAQWDWRFLSLIAISTIVDFIAGNKIAATPGHRGRWLLASVGTNLGILGFFKYYDFFITEAVSGLNAIGFEASPWTLSIILPVGISFYTFQTMTYTIDIYRGNLRPTKDFLAFATFVAFFPQLVAGPIERAAHLLPQFENLWKYNEEKITQGLRLILFGLALKMGVADNLAPVVDELFGGYERFDGGSLAMGSVLFAFQIYGDFCGYSTIAIGLAKILGFELMTNFRTPYFATSIQDFWRRWHISLSTFFRDYVYIPLGGSRTSGLKNDRNLIITFVVSGLWHGANWTFIVWGFYHGLLLGLQRRLPDMRISKLPAALGQLISMGVTFTLVCIGWVIFRSQTLTQAWEYLSKAILEFEIPNSNRDAVWYVLLAVFLDFLWKADTRLEKVNFANLTDRYALVVRWSTFCLIFWTVIVGLANRSGVQQFIYFQF